VRRFLRHCVFAPGIPVKSGTNISTKKLH